MLLARAAALLSERLRGRVLSIVRNSVFHLAGQNFHDMDGVADNVGGRRSPFGPVGMVRLPHGLSEMLGNRCHGAIHYNLMAFVEDDSDRFITNFNDKPNELRVNCDAFTTPAFCQERKVIYHPCAP